MNGDIAGHTFLNGICVKPRFVGAASETCNIRWCDIRNCRAPDDVDSEGIAHIGKSTPAEVGQIEKARASEDRAIADATGWSVAA